MDQSAAHSKKPTPQRVSVKTAPQLAVRRHINETHWTLWNFYRHVSWTGLLITVLIPLLGVYWGLYTPLEINTLRFSLAYYVLTTTAFLAGYHRLWAHRSFRATIPVKLFYACFGASAGLGSAKSWAAMHRAHHRYIDTEKDPHSIRRGIWFAHMGWALTKPHIKVRNSCKECMGDDLEKDTLLEWQERNYKELMILTTFLVPAMIAGLGWGDYFGGLVFAGILRGAALQQTTFIVNSLGHLFGTQPFDDRKSHRNNIVLSLLSFGEGMNNFHHEFSSDFRNGIHWYDFDPVKWHLVIMSWFGLVDNLYRTSDAAIYQCIIQQQQKLIDRKRSKLNWGMPIDQLPIISPEEFRKLAKDEAPHRALIAVAGIVHDVTPFINDHPGGVALIRTSIGKDATSAFNGAVYDHSTAAHNLLATMRVAVLSGGTEQIVWKQQQVENKDVPLKQDSEGRKIVRTGEQATIIKKPVRTADAA